MKQVRIAPTFEAWRSAARRLLEARIPPDEATWVQIETRERPLFESGPGSAPPATGARMSVPKTFLALAERVACHSDPGRWALLYRLLWRIVHEQRELLTITEDADVARALALQRDVEAAPPPPPASPASAAPFLPAARTVVALRDAAVRCTGCSLYENATQTVFSAGPADARAMFIGEQPGDQEDLQGLPFVGPAGDVLSRALAEVGLARDAIYVTNAVKHFKFEPRGKRRIHKTPEWPEIQACRPWLEAEIAAVRPALIVCLGATAAQALMGPQFRVLKNRGRIFQTAWAPELMVTVHPSSILRVDDPTAQAQAYRDFVADLRTAAGRLAEARPASEIRPT